MFPAMWLPDTQARRDVHVSLSCPAALPPLGLVRCFHLFLVVVLTGGFAGSGSAVTLGFFLR